MVVPRGIILGVPVAIGVSILASGVAFMIAVRTTDGVAKGPRVRTTVTSSCDVMPTLIARLDAYGLAPEAVGPELRFSLPGLPGDMTDLPAALIAEGELRVDGERLVPNNAGVQISLQGTAVTLLTLNVAPADRAAVLLDDVVMEVTSQNGGELQLAAWAATSSDALRIATDRSVALRLPLPCAATLSPLELL